MDYLGLRWALNSQEEELVKNLCEEDEGEGEVEVSWILHEGEVARACQYELNFDMGLFSDD